LRQAAAADGVIARLGGDEFAVLVERPRPGELTEIADRVVHAFREPCRPGDHIQARVHASVGAALAGPQISDAAVLLHLADQAMYAAKCSGKGAYRLAQAG
jgi:diguanylate cyclase (GGDEF)-like protein